MDADTGEFTLQEARSILAALRSTAPDGLDAPLSRDDLMAILGAGVEVKDIARGLIDFPTTVDSTMGAVEAYWCWQSGEDEIGWWHPRSTGFSGRQRIADLPGQAASNR
ncbi:MAG: DUF2203 domain-containing protein [Dehalococcoidia bacterium]|nr:DUF2203 domain-containing protein [Dehalococcoidia bacterium]